MNAKVKGKFQLLFQTVEIIVIFLTVALVNVNSLIRFRQFPEVDNYSDHEGDYIFVAYFTAWKQNKRLIAFLIYASISLLWSVYIPATFYKLIFLFFSTIAGSYLAVRYKHSGVIDIFIWVGAIFCVLSILLVG